MLYPEERLAEEVIAGVHSSEIGLQLAKRFADANGVSLEVKVLRGGVAPQIIREAEFGLYDLVVLGDTGRTGLARLAMGSVAQAVVKGSPVPVLVEKT